MADNHPEDDFDFETALINWMTLDGKYFVDEADYHANGMKWRVYANDADPFPSSPHAHCIDGPARFKGV